MDVVQLFDLSVAFSQAASHLAANLLDEVARLGHREDDPRVLQLADGVRDLPGFVSHGEVRQFCRARDLRYLPELETWHAGALPPAYVVGLHPFSILRRRVPDGAT